MNTLRAVRSVTPHLATVEKGERIFDTLGNEFADLLANIYEQTT